MYPLSVRPLLLLSGTWHEGWLSNMEPSQCPRQLLVLFVLAFSYTATTLRYHVRNRRLSGVVVAVARFQTQSALQG